MKSMFNKLLLCAAMFGVVASGKANTTPQTLPFSQNWTNIGFITVNDDWSGVPGIVGFLGDDPATTAPDVDPRTITQDLLTVDVNANQTNPDTFTSGGVTEFEITNPTIAFQGSGTADYTNIVVYLNTTGQSNVNVAFNARDIDMASDVVQQLNVQYRVGGTGVYTNVTGGYFADVSAVGNTLVTPVSLTLPAAANNQSIVEVRIMTTNATGSDEFIGIDDISVTAGPAAPVQNVVDFNGDGRTDYAVVRNTGGGPSGQRTWYIQMNGSASVQGAAWGIGSDQIITDDFDGDLKSDIAVWRSGAPDVAAFYILQSATNTVRTSLFGQTGDDASVVGDYDGDNKADVAVYRPGATSGLQSFWYYRGSLNNPSGNITYTQWGQNGDFPAPGDYDGDGKNDFVVQRNAGGGTANFFLNRTTAGSTIVNFGTPTDVIVPGDYDGDGKTDIATVRGILGELNWFWLPSSGGAFQTRIYGASATDIPTQGDYDGDGKTDVAVFRPLATGFYSLSSVNGSSTFQSWGVSGDLPVASFNNH